MKSSLNVEYFEKKDDLHSFFISEITDSENVVRLMSKKSCFRGSFDKQRGKRAQALLKSASQDLHHIHQSAERKLCSKKSLLLTCKIFGLLVNILAIAKKYLVLHRDNLTIPIQMQLSQKRKNFSQYFVAFLKYSLSFKHFEKKDVPHSFCISKITESKIVFRQMS